MGIDLKLNLRLSQQLVMTPQLQQAIKLLQMNRLELTQTINQELVDNPLLEEVMESVDAEGESSEPTTDQADPEAEQKRDEMAYEKPAEADEAAVKTKDDFNWESYIEDFNSNYSTSAPMREINDELPQFESVLTKTTSLEDHLLWQLSMSELADDEKNFGRLVVGNLSDDGYLIASLEDIAKESSLEVEDAEEVLKILQRFDPIGACSRDLRECLLIQASFMKPRQPLVERIIDNHLADLEKRAYNVIAKALEIPLDKVIEATKLIMEFEPKPGRGFQAADTQYITPDIYVYKLAEEFVIVLNEEGLPRLRISNYYKEILAQKNADNKQTKEYVQDKLRSALWMIRSIHNRQKTIYKVTDAIVKRQREFFEVGVQALKPMILRDIAGDIGMHESTISRVTTNKFVHTPVGIFELKYFFNSSIGAADGSDAVASEAVKERIKTLVSSEDARRPLSDQKLVELLRAENIEIARRTVAKYREMLGILSSGKRKKVF